MIALMAGLYPLLSRLMAELDRDESAGPPHA